MWSAARSGVWNSCGTWRPGEPAGADPRDTGQSARAAFSLTVASLENPAPPAFVAAHPEARLRDFPGVVTLEFLAHSWDIGHPAGVDERACRLSFLGRTA
ncbi:hypothetical protein [Sciscionella marina]|uniref:hypothetical protein n=1 Tax=Sciscionella marina TaxID=508770 RepID=UPI00037E3D69|nr:hypothetical protein [Sciscionella marina]